MKNKKTYYQIILDRSGSMSSCIEGTMEGYNAQIDMIRDFENKFPEQEINVSVTTFNDHIDLIASKRNAKDIPYLTRENYIPAGSTSLLDAIGMSVTKLNGEIQQEIQNDLASVVVVILTDGHENSSRRFNHKQIASLIKELELTDKWTFSFLSATWDAIEVASSLNIQRANSRMFDKANIKQEFLETNLRMQEYMDAKKAGRIKKNLW